MARSKAAWGIEVGASAIKAIRLERDGDRVTVADFAVVPHKKVLATPDIDQDETVRLSLGQFISQKALEGETLIMSVPGHAAFARFAKLPPVDPKKVPDIVRFEAVQQIPFPIDQVEWDYQTFVSEGSPEVEVGIFAITRDRVQQRLGLYRDLGIVPQALTLSPVAVYNAMAFDHDLAARPGPVLYLDIGTFATDVIVADRGRCWIRTFPLGGTHFTEAIASAFKLSYSKAEKLKAEAASSQYAKQIMQAMRPVFSDLLQDLQRSIGYYQSLHRDAQLDTMVGLGSTFKIPGLRKFLGQQLQITVQRLDEYRKLTVTGREAAAFAQDAVTMATAYGLALQGVGLARITANLVPVENVRAQLWREKTKWFAAAAAVMVAGSAMMLYRPIADRNSMRPQSDSPEVANVLALGQKLKRDYDQVLADSRVGFAAENFRRLVDYREVWPHLIDDAAEALASADPQQELLGSKIDPIMKIPPQERKLVQLEDLSGVYMFEAPRSRRIAVTMNVQLSHDRPIEFLTGTVAAWLRENAEREGVPYRILPKSISCNPGAEKTVLVTGSGEQVAGRAAPEGQRAPPGPGGRAGGQAPPPGAGSSNPAGMGTGDGMMGRREKQGKREAPGKGIGSLDSGSSSRSIPPVGNKPAEGIGPRIQRSTSSGESVEAMKDIDEIAPVPGRPSVYPAGSQYYLVPITFEVELLDRFAPKAPGQTAAGPGVKKDGRS